MPARTSQPFNDLVAASVGPGKRWTVREFAERAVDPESGYSPSKSLIGNIIQGKSPQPTPELISAIAAGLGIARAVVEDAAIRQWIRTSDIEGQQVYHHADVSIEGAQLTREAIERVKAEADGVDESNGP
ncbi:helix-turn-helix domain-containing protein [Embleya hyalina]|uniref:Uncharacterized protein n=1 Tax=Embleya hyalina TaxID=516124 RepID=A0A401YHF6_9ACTN|nr:helix-turn-helix domain-containing protein [Embleya hyalina]GCD94041.1 hypothetical protein EHYA_01697 [Embleya hyalina]